MQYIYIISVWLHILAAMVWMGGAAFIALVLVPAMRRPELKSSSASLLHWSTFRFRAVGWSSLIVLVLTGLVNLHFRGITWSRFLDGSMWQGPFGHVLAAKLSLVAGIFIISATHDFFLGPKAAAVILKDPDSARAGRLRKTASWMGRLTLLLALAVVALAVMLVRGLPT